MVKFLIYLFESGLCLLILFSIYQLFFRNETYFHINRLYLLSIVFLAIVVPLVHITIRIPDTRLLTTPVSEIGKFRNYYEKLIALTDPGYNNPENYQSEPAVFEGYSATETTKEELKKFSENPEIHPADISANSPNKVNIKAGDILLILYLAGLVLFLGRLLLLLYGIARLVRKNSHVSEGKLKIVHLSKPMPPFSFFRYVFIDTSTINATDYDQILAHEKVHAGQYHSVDILVVHFLILMQWFNPLVWQLLKAVKTNHEFIADRKIVDQGFELFDYQSLILSQLISVRSVELVNNLNLLSIKKRITMMTKIKSGIASRLKALLILPAVLAVFLIFSDMTLYGPGYELSNFSLYNSGNLQSKLNGLWNNTDQSDIKTISFEDQHIYMLNKNNELQQYTIEITPQKILVGEGPHQISLKYNAGQDELTIWWKENQPSTYNKSMYNNTMNQELAGVKADIELPGLVSCKTLVRTNYTTSLMVNSNSIILSGNKINLNQLADKLKERKARLPLLDQRFFTVRLFIDQNTSMELVSEMLNIMRENNFLKISFAGFPKEDKIPRIMYYYAGLNMLLPPPDAKIIAKEKVKKMGINLFEINTMNNNYSAETMKEQIYNNIINHKEYLLLLNYDNSLKYGDYIGYVDGVFTVINKFREKYARQEYNLSFDELAAVQQDMIRKKYPVVLTQQNVSQPSD